VRNQSLGPAGADPGKISHRKMKPNTDRVHCTNLFKSNKRRLMSTELLIIP
jgi:hypothetical protein